METPKTSTFKAHFRRIEKIMDQTPTSMDTDYCKVLPINRSPKPNKSTIHNDIVRLSLDSFLSTPVKTVGVLTSTPMPRESLSTMKNDKKVNRILFNGPTPNDLKNGSYNQREQDDLVNQTKNLELTDKKNRNIYSKLLMQSMNQSANDSGVDRSWLTLV